MDAAGIWTANKYIRDPIGDGGSPRIPTLKTTNAEGEATEITDNQDKAKSFAQVFFPRRPQALMYQLISDIQTHFQTRRRSPSGRSNARYSDSPHTKLTDQTRSPTSFFKDVSKLSSTTSTTFTDRSSKQAHTSTRGANSPLWY
jgi:hypothetical protein